MFTTGNATVDAIGTLHLEGNVIPHTWYQNLTFDNGKPDLNSIIILAEIIYWHRPTYVKDEVTGQLVTIKKKFHADLLQRSYESFATQFNLSKKQVKEAFDRLEVVGVVKREFRQVGTGSNTLYNVMFIHLNVGLLEGITFEVRRVVTQTAPPSDLQSVVGSAVDVGTNTEITTDITTNINNDNDKQPVHVSKLKHLNAFEFFEQNHIGRLSHHMTLKIDGWINDMSEELVIHAMKKAVEQGKYTWSYVERILKNWWAQQLTTLDAIEAEDNRWKAKQQSKQRNQYQSKAPVQKGPVPDWFHKRNEEQQQETTEQPNTNIDFEAERKKILESLGKIEATAQEKL